MLRIAERFTRSPVCSASVLLALIVGTGGCSGGSPPSTGAASPSPSASVDVVAAASEKLQEGFDADFDLTMTIKFLGREMTARGTGHMAGRDIEMEMTASDIGRQSIVVVGGVSYQKVSNGPWVRQPSDGQGSDIALSLATVDSTAPLRTGKSLTWHDQPVQVLTRTLSGPSAIGALGLKGMADAVTLRQRVLVQEDGTPVQLVGQASMTMYDQRMKLHVVMAFDPSETPTPVVAPSDPWKAVDVHNGMQAAIPTTWTRLREGQCGDCDRFGGDPQGQVLLVSSPSPSSPEATIHVVMHAVDDRGGTSTRHRAMDIDHVTWQVAVMSDRASTGGATSLTVGAAVIGGRGVLVYSWSNPGEPEASEKMLKQFASTISVVT